MTNATLHAAVLIGEAVFNARKLKAASRRGSGVPAGQIFFYLVIVAAVIAVVCLAIYFGTRALQRRRQYSHGGLFGGLCRVHGLNHRTKALLKKVASLHKLEYPARLFIEPKWLDPAALDGSLRSQAAEVTAVRNQLFSETSG